MVFKKGKVELRIKLRGECEDSTDNEKVQSIM